MPNLHTDWPSHQYVPFSRKHQKLHGSCNGPTEMATVHEHKSMSKSVVISLAKENGN